MENQLIAEFDKIVEDVNYARAKVLEARANDEEVVVGPRGGQKITAWMSILDQHQQALMRIARLFGSLKIEKPIPDAELEKLLDD